MYAANWHTMRSFSRDRSITHQRLKPGIVRRVLSYPRPYPWILALVLIALTVVMAFTPAKQHLGM